MVKSEEIVIRGDEFMNIIDVLDTAVNINGHILEFPMSYGEIKEFLGEARIVTDGEAEAVHTTYYYDDLGIEVEPLATLE